jgi:hypothetical protein
MDNSSLHMIVVRRQVVRIHRMLGGGLVQIVMVKVC